MFEIKNIFQFIGAFILLFSWIYGKFAHDKKINRLNELLNNIYFCHSWALFCNTLRTFLRLPALGELGTNDKNIIKEVDDHLRENVKVYLENSLEAVKGISKLAGKDEILGIPDLKEIRINAEGENIYKKIDELISISSDKFSAIADSIRKKKDWWDKCSMWYYIAGSIFVLISSLM